MLDAFLGCVYFDRSKGGPDRGVWAIEVWEGERLVLTYWRREAAITSNQAVLKAVLETLTQLRGAQLLEEGAQMNMHTIYQYLYRGFTQWSKYWLTHDFRGKVSGAPIRNLELWQQLLDQRRYLTFHYYRKGTNPTINRLLDFCWEKFDLPPDVHQPEDGVPQWYPPSPLTPTPTE